MAHQGVIYPNKPLVLVLKGWQQNKSTSPASDDVRGSSCSIRTKSPTILDPTSESAEFVARTDAVRDGSTGSPSLHQQDGSRQSSTNASRTTSSRGNKRSFRFIDSLDSVRNKYKKRPLTSNRSAPSNRRYGYKVRPPGSSRHGATYLQPEVHGMEGQPINHDHLDGQDISAIHLSPRLSPRALFGFTEAISPANIPIHPERNMHALFDHYVHIACQLMYPPELRLSYIPPVRDWLPSAMKDELHMNAILTTAAIHRATRTGTADAKLAMLMLGNTYNLLQARLRSPLTLNDATVAAVTCLILIENIRGEYEASKTHAKAIREMVKVKGGFSNINEKLRIKVLRADILASVNSLSQSSWSNLDRTAPSLHSMLPENLKSTSSSTIFFSNVKSSSLMISLHAVQEFCMALDYMSLQSTESIPPLSFDEDAIELKCNLLLVCKTEISTDLDRVCCLTALMFLNLSSGGVVRKGDSIFETYLACLERELNAREQNSPSPSALRSSSSSLTPSTSLLWVLFFGLMASQNDPSMRPSWLVTSIYNISRDQENRLLDWPTVRVELKKSLWIDVLFDDLGSQLWNKITSVVP